MIRYLITDRELRARINAIDPQWLADAAGRTRRFRKLGRYQESSANWKKIKDVYRNLQHNKCAYCERLLEIGRSGSVDHDVEHFRPKGAVKEWPGKSRPRRGYTFATGKASSKGYYLLPYNIWNYATACKTCNTALKRNYFPIASARARPMMDIKGYQCEQQLLIYPIGTIDEDPERLIAFEGLTPVPVAALGHDNNRARVTIDFFRLDDRELLLWQRAEIINQIWITHSQTVSGQTEADRKIASETIARLIHPSHDHSSCAKCFLNLLRRDPGRAADVHAQVWKYLSRQS